MGTELPAPGATCRLKSFSVHTPTYADIEYIADHLRVPDWREAYAWGIDPHVGILMSIQTSEENWVARLDDKPIAIWGCSQGGQVWMVGTDDIGTIPFTVVKEFKRRLHDLNQKYGHLWNYIHRDNSVHIKLLHLCGAIFEPIDEDFLQFHVFSS